MVDDRQSQADIDARLARAHSAQGGDVSGPAKPAKGYGQGSRVLAELIGAPLGGGILGWALDRWLGTSPWFLLGLIVLAVIAAFRNIYKISKERAE